MTDVTPPRRWSPASVARISRKVPSRLERLLLTRIQPLRSFALRGERYRYFAGDYNSAWHNERTVEIPVAVRYLQRYSDRRVLEVGNVLAHYVPVRHDVVDKYERASGVLNVDVVDYRPDRLYDLILSVSTLEHVGWDEKVIEADKPVQAVEHLASLLAPGGELVITLPFGWNPHVDAAIRTNGFEFDDIVYLRRVSRDNRWREVDASDLVSARYGSPFPATNALAIGLRTEPRGIARLGNGREPIATR